MRPATLQVLCNLPSLHDRVSSAFELAPKLRHLLPLPPHPRPARYVPLWGKRQYRVDEERPATPFEEQVGLAGGGGVRPVGTTKQPVALG